MEYALLSQIRSIILESTTVSDVGIHFDTYKALDKGFTEDKIAIVDDILLNHSYYTKDFLDDVCFYCSCEEAKPSIYYVDFAKIVFILDFENQVSTHVFEEDLLTAVADRRIFGMHLEWVMENSISDAFGNQLQSDRIGYFFR